MQKSRENPEETILERAKAPWRRLGGRFRYVTFGHVVVGITFFAVVAGAVTIFVFTPLPGERTVKNLAEYSEIIRNYFFAGAGLGAATIGLYLAWVRTRAAADQAATGQLKEEREAESQREFLYTQSYTRAIEQLGSEDLSIRLGGIYALERVARESEKDHWSIMEVLTAYVRENSPCSPSEGNTLDKKVEGEIGTVKPRLDIQAILTVIGRRNATHEDKRQILDIRETDLRGIELIGANLQEINLEFANLADAHIQSANLRNANLTNANLCNANLNFGNLNGADLERANLTDAVLFKANLSAAFFVNANLTRARLVEADLRRAILEEAILEGADLMDANLQGAILSKAKLCNSKLNGTDLRGADLSDANFLRIHALDHLMALAVIESLKNSGQSVDEWVSTNQLAYAAQCLEGAIIDQDTNFPDWLQEYKDDRLKGVKG